MSTTSHSSGQPSVEQLSQLETANRLKSEFIANVSHELRTPLHAIVGYAELLLEGVYGTLNDEQAQTVQYVNDSASDLLGIVNNLLDLSKIESGRADLILSSFDLRDLIGELLTQIKPLADEKHLVLESTVKVDNSLIRTDRGKMKQILTNLVGNAVKFTDSGKVTVVVSPASVSPAKPNGPHSRRLLISVQDTGVGIPADKLDKIFEKFYQVDGSASRSHEGTGLGLYITKQLLELIAGTVEVKSTAGKGTTVTISLPENYEEIEGIQRLRRHLATAKATAHSEQGASDRLVLAVSDNPDIARILTDGLGSADYSVRVVHASNEVISLARKLRPLVILLNAENSSSEFWSIFQELKSHTETKDIPTIFLGNDDARHLGVPLSVAAPMNRQEVLRSIRATTRTGKKNVLIVDDDESFREVLKCVLAEEGYQISEAADGKDALARLAEVKPDLLVLDLHIPEIDGWEVIRHITQDAGLKDMEVLVISGDMLDDKETAVINARAAGFICKADFKVNTVLDKVADLLEVN
jgi:CheY-like chemotaxis protein/nitrogen-specific signal transduction histidine kinase